MNEQFLLSDAEIIERFGKLMTKGWWDQPNLWHFHCPPPRKGHAANALFCQRQLEAWVAMPPVSGVF